MIRKFKFSHKVVGVKSKATIHPNRIENYEIACWTEPLNGNRFELTNRSWNFEVLEKPKSSSVKYGPTTVSGELDELIKEKLADGKTPVIVYADGKTASIDERDSASRTFPLPFHAVEVEVEGPFNSFSGAKLVDVTHKRIYKKWKRDGVAPTYVRVLGGNEKNRKEIAATGNLFWGLIERSFSANAELESERLNIDAKAIGKLHENRIKKSKGKNIVKKAIESTIYAAVLGTYHRGNVMRAENNGCISYVDQAEATGFEIPSDIAECARQEYMGTIMANIGLGLAIAIPTTLAAFYGGKRLINKKRYGHGGGILTEKERWGSWTNPGLYDFVAACQLCPTGRNPSESTLINWDYQKGRK